MSLTNICAAICWLQKAVGARSYIPNARARLLKQKRPPQWLLKVLDGMDERLEPLPKALAAYRDEVKP